MTDERAKEIVEELRLKLNVGTVATTSIDTADLVGLALHLYDEVQTMKANQAGLAFMSAGIQPVRKVDQ